MWWILFPHLFKEPWFIRKKKLIYEKRSKYCDSLFNELESIQDKCCLVFKNNSLPINNIKTCLSNVDKKGDKEIKIEFRKILFNQYLDVIGELIRIETAKMVIGDEKLIRLTKEIESKLLPEIYLLLEKFIFEDRTNLGILMKYALESSQITSKYINPILRRLGEIEFGS